MDLCQFEFECLSGVYSRSVTSQPIHTRNSASFKPDHLRPRHNAITLSQRFLQAHAIATMSVNGRANSVNSSQAGGNGFLSFNSMPPRLVVTAEDDEFDEQTLQNWRDEGMHVGLRSCFTAPLTSLFRLRRILRALWRRRKTVRPSHQIRQR